VSTTAGAGGGPRGASSGQMATLIAINRGILYALQLLTGRTTHPEATAQKLAQAVPMDIFNW
jgi:hypothetical protein